MKIVRPLIYAAVLSALLAPSALAQEDPVTQEKWKNGFLPTGTYGGGRVSVNLHSGNVIATVPLFTLPGRAGHDLSVTAVYNSKQMVRRAYGGYPPYYSAEYFHRGPTAGRWVLNVWPTLEVASTFPYVPQAYFTTPDGAGHKLDRWNGAHAVYSSDAISLTTATRCGPVTGTAGFSSPRCSSPR